MAYLDQLKRLFTGYIHQNFNVQRITVSWKDIEDKNMTMVARAFLMLCRYLHLIPNLFNAEALHHYLQQTLPPISNGEHEFYENKKIIAEYDDESWQQKFVEPFVNEKGELTEPALHFHEFLFLLGLIAKNCIKSAKNNTIQQKLIDFYVEKLQFNEVDMKAIEELTYDDVLQQMENDEYGDEKYDRIDGDMEDGDEWNESEEEFEEPQGRFAKKQKRQ